MTTQVPDKLLLAGQVFDTSFTSGMARGRIPDKHPGIRRATEQDLSHATHPAGLEHSTTLWRGYIATWALKERCLYLDNIEGLYAKAGDVPIFVDWVSDTLVICMGPLLLGPELSNDSSCLTAQELRVHVEAGRVVGTLLIDWQASCPASLRKEDEKASRRWHFLARGGSLPLLSVEQLTEALGKVEREEPRPVEWWEYNYSANKSRKERQALLRRLQACGRRKPGGRRIGGC